MYPRHVGFVYFIHMHSIFQEMGPTKTSYISNSTSYLKF